MSNILSPLDESPISIYHVKAVFLSGMGFYTDAYDLFVISLVTQMIGFIYFKKVTSYADDLWIKSASLVGTIFGQLIFGLYGDYFGRKSSYLYTILIILLGTIAQAFTGNLVFGFGIVGVISIWRFITGFGVGGEYPLSAVIVAEYGNRKYRGAMIAMVFAMQGLGVLTASVVCIVTVRCFRDLILKDLKYLDLVWRIALGFSIFPSLVTVYARTLLPEPPRYTLYVEKDVKKTELFVFSLLNNRNQNGISNDMSPNTSISFSSIINYISKPKTLRNLLVSCIGWFMISATFYSQNLFIPEILHRIGFSPTVLVGDFLTDLNAVYRNVYYNCVGYLIFSIAGTIPGGIICILLIDKIGRKKLQYIGYIVVILAMSLIVGFYNTLRDKAIFGFIILYTVTFLFLHIGPNTIAFVYPAEIFQTKYRSTMYGICSASGKAGALVGLLMFRTLALHHGNQIATGALLPFLVVGFLTTFFMTETKGKTLEELDADDSN